MARLATLEEYLCSYAFLTGLLIFGYIVASKIRTYWRLKSFHGPFLANFSELWVFRATLAGDLHERSLHVINEYGGEESIARFGPNLLMTTDAAWWKTINENRSWKKGSWYPAMALDPGHDSVFSTTDDVKHDKLKDQLTRGVRSKPGKAMELLVTFIVFRQGQSSSGRRY